MPHDFRSMSSADVVAFFDLLARFLEMRGWAVTFEGPCSIAVEHTEAPHMRFHAYGETPLHALVLLRDQMDFYAQHIADTWMTLDWTEPVSR